MSFPTKYSLFKILYVLILVLAGIYCTRRPMYNWDMLPYMDLVLQMDHRDPQEAHDLTYRLARENIPAEDFRQLTDSQNSYRFKVFHDANAFNDQVPFYAVKPLFTAMVYLSWKAGLSLPQATVVPSFVAYLLIGFLLFYWLSLYIKVSNSFIISLLLMLSSPVLEVAKLSTPDCLSAFLLLSSFYFILQRHSLLAAVIFLGLSIFVRLDNVITCLLAVSSIYFSKRWHRQISTGAFLASIALFVACYFGVTVISSQYGWGLAFYNHFVSRLHPTYGAGNDFSFSSYFRLMYEHTLSAINHSYFALFLIFPVLSLAMASRLKKSSFDEVFAFTMLAIFGLRFILYPDVSDRFYIPFYLVGVILLVRTLRSFTRPASAQTGS